ncbi:MAG: hypothetical protein WDW38_011317 [Sanguina aurantia]
MAGRGGGGAKGFRPTRAPARQSRYRSVRPTRAARLCALGLLLQSGSSTGAFPAYDLSRVRYLGVLQRIALCVLSVSAALILSQPGPLPPTISSNSDTSGSAEESYDVTADTGNGTCSKPEPGLHAAAPTEAPACRPAASCNANRAAHSLLAGPMGGCVLDSEEHSRQQERESNQQHSLAACVHQSSASFPHSPSRYPHSDCNLPTRGRDVAQADASGCAGQRACQTACTLTPPAQTDMPGTITHLHQHTSLNKTLAESQTDSLSASRENRVLSPSSVHARSLPAADPLQHRPLRTVSHSWFSCTAAGVQMSEAWNRIRNPGGASDSSSLFPPWLPVAAVVLVTYHMVIMTQPVPTCPSLVPALSPDCNMAAYLDVQVFGAEHLYAWPACRKLTHPCKHHDPEGLLSTVGAILTSICGLWFGHILQRYKGHWERLLLFRLSSFLLTASGLGLLALGVPLNKGLYTTSFVLLTSGNSGTLCTVLYLILDCTDATTGLNHRFTTALEFLRASLQPFVWIGTNALTVYVLNLLWRKAQRWVWYGTPGNSMLVWLPKGVGFCLGGNGRAGAAVYAAAVLGVFTLLARDLHKRGIVYKI